MTDQAPTQPRVRPRAQVRVAALCVIGLAYLGADALTQPWWLGRRIGLARDSGWLALVFLLAALCVTPAGRVLAWLRAPVASSLPRVRRALGIASACFALLHAALGFFGLLRAPFSLLFGWPHLRAGLLALCVLVALLLSSFPSLVRLLGLRTWKELHRLAYVAALLVLQHVLLAPFAPRATVLLLFALAAGVGLLRWLPRPPGDHTSSGMPDSTQKRSSTPL